LKGFHRVLLIGSHRNSVFMASSPLAIDMEFPLDQRFM